MTWSTAPNTSRVGWTTWKLGHAFRLIGSGTTPPTDRAEYFDGSIPWVTTAELRETVIESTLRTITQRAVRDFPTLRIYPPGTLLVAMYGATIGRLGILGTSAATNQACCAFAQARSLDPKFLFYWLAAFKAQILELATGGGQPNINQEKLRVSYS